MSNILIEANNISKIYDPDILLKRGHNFYALHQVNFALSEGDFVSVMGPSGSGKSTLLNCISTLDNISKGSIKILGDPVSTLNDDQLSTFRYEQLGFIFQNHNLISTLSIYDNIATPIILGKKAPTEINARIQELATRLNITNILDKKPGECSGGEKQRASIARALVNNPKILICDEPTGNLDSANSHEVLSILSELNQQGTSIILVTHDNMIASYAKTLFYLRDGQIQSVLHRNGASQIDFFNEIVKVTTEDSLLKFFNKQEATSEDASSNNPVSSINKEVIDNDSNPRKENLFAVFPNGEAPSKEENYNTLTVTNKTLEYDNVLHHHIVIEMSDIKEMHYCLEPIWRNFGLFSEWVFYVRLEILTNKAKYVLVLKNKNDLTPLFTLFKEANLPITDILNIASVYQQNPDELPRHRYFQHHYKQWKKEYNL